MTDWVKKTCALCPFSRSKTLWLHPDRAHDFAYMAQNPYSDFPCHKTAELHEDDDSSGYVRGARSKTCHGFMTLQCAENGRTPEGFAPDGDGFEDAYEMIDAHTEHWEDSQARRKAAS